MQMLLREELGNNFDAALTRILVEIHEVDFLAVLQARAIYDYIVGQWLMLHRGNLCSFKVPYAPP